MNTFTVFKKEIRTYFNSPIAYIVIVLFLLISGYFFSAPIFIINQASIRHLIDLFPLLFLFFIPAITMRLFSEEQKTGTIEILMTLPLKEYEILLGKFLSSVVLVSICVLMTLFYSIILSFFGKIDTGQIFVSYLGVILLGMTFSSIGIFSSSITKNQIVSFIVAFVICFALFMLGKITIFIPSFLVGLVEFIGIDSHFENTVRGIIDTRDVVYYSSISVLFLYMTLCRLKFRK